MALDTRKIALGASKKVLTKVSDWDNTRKSIKAVFEKAGITSCELSFYGCSGANYLSFAHSRKRREISGDELREVVLACQSCHNRLERMTHEEMYELVNLVIKGRGDCGKTI